MNVLVTGGLGFIGHQVVKRLMRRGDDTVIMDTQTDYGIIPHSELQYLMGERLKKINNHPVIHADISAGGPVDYAIARDQPEVIIHCASVPRQKVVNANPVWGADVMIRGLINLLESAKKHQVRRFVYVSSSMVYGDFKDQVTEESPCNPQGQYGIMKLAGEWLVKDYACRYGFEYVIIRPSAVYGPLDVEDRVVAKFMIAAMHNGTLKVNGAEETLDFTYVDDAADGIVASATLPQAANNTFNITKSHGVTLRRAAMMIVSIVGSGNVECRDRDLDFPSRGALNIDKARDLLGYNPKIDVEEGFQNYYKWLRESTYWNVHD
jgi:nucleoside-diphosphate-sugar epimerase